jgi:hypothetical protein
MGNEDKRLVDPAENLVTCHRHEGDYSSTEYESLVNQFYVATLI